MSSSLARLRAFALTFLSLAMLSHALEGSLFTSSVTYCAPPETLLIQQFDVQYFAANNSVSFNISAESVDSNVNVSASMLVNVFGIEPVNITIDLCGILNGALCPLPQYNFTGSDSITLPDSIQSNFPSIAFKIPDLEGYAQLTLTEASTGDVKACVQATLSNGLSTHQRAVEWTTGSITLVTLLVALWQSHSPTAILPARLLDLIFLFQTIAVSALLNLNYPVTFISYALNFAWSLALFSSGDDSMQRAINNMRALTGGGLANSTSSSAVAFVNRKLSPFNSESTSSSGGISSLSSLAKRAMDSTLINGLQQRDVAVVTSESDNVLSAGIPIYVSTINIATANAFMTVFLCTLILIAIALFVFAAGWAVLFMIEKYGVGREEQQVRMRRAYPSWIRAWTLRLSLIMFLPIVLFAFYQWTLNDSWLSILFSVIAFLGIMTAVCYPCVVIIRSVRRSEPSVLYTDPHLRRSYPPLYAQYLPNRYHFFVFLVVATFFKAIIVSFISSSGMAQVILFLILEIAMVLRLVLLRPHKTRGADIFSSFLGIIRVVCTGLMIAFVQSIGVKPIPRYAIGLVLAVVYSITILVVIFNLVLHSGVQRLWKRRQVTSSSSSSTKSSLPGSSNLMLEKDVTSSDYSPSHSFGRPTNPTPERNVELDPEINQPYNPSSPTATITDYTSTRQRDSESTNFGSVLPRRWSFTPLHTPTDSSALDHNSPPFESTLSRTSEEQLEKEMHSHT